MDYVDLKITADKWGITRRRAQKLCEEGRIKDAKKIGNSWAIPVNAEKPEDARFKNKDSLITSIDLFAGPGGLCTGFRWAGIKALIAVEWSYWTVQTYAHSHNADIFDLEKYLDGTMPNPEQYFKPSDKTLLIYGDIRKVTEELIREILEKRFHRNSVDIVTGGAPCESFSMAGDRKEDDDRNVLYTNVLRIARGIDSKMFLFENVKGLFSKKLDGVAGGMYKAICEDFQRVIPDRTSFKLAETDPSKVLLKAIEYGVPQMRERLFLVGINRKYPDAKFHYPMKTNGPDKEFDYVTVGNAIMDLPQVDSGIENNVYDHNLQERYDDDTDRSYKTRLQFLNRMRGFDCQPPKQIHFNEHYLCSHKGPGHTKKMLQRISSIQPGEGMKAAYNRLLKNGEKEFVEKYFPKKIYAARNRRLVLDKPSFTVTSHCLDEMIHPVLNRGLTPREAARLQSFPDWYQFQGPYVKFHSDPEQDQYEQIGDAIPPLLAFALGKEVSKTINEIKSKSKD